MKTRVLAVTLALALLTGLPTVWGNHQNGNPECDPSNFDTTPTFTDGCYHQGVWFSPDTPQYDVIILPPTSANEIRDWQLLEQSLDNWEVGIKALGADWLAEGLKINDYTVGKEFVPAEALSDPEVVIALHTSAGPLGSYVGLATYLAGVCHGVGLTEDLSDMPGWHNHPGASIGHFVTECGGGGHVCTVTNVGPASLDNANDRRVHFDLISHEIGHCLTLGHVGDAADAGDRLDNSIAYPEHDIMSYESDGHHASTMHCPSNLNVRTIEAAFAHQLGQGGSTANQVQNGANAHYEHMHPDEYVQHDCVQSTATALDAEWLTTFDPTAEDEDADPGTGGEPSITIDSPDDGATVAPGKLAVTGDVNRQGASALTASVSAPDVAATGDPVPIEGSATGGASADGFTCSWSDDSGASTYDDASACQTSVTFDATGEFTLALTVDDGSATDDATHAIRVQAGGLPSPDGSITGGFFAYNEGGVGASNVAALVTGEAGDPVPKYAAGETVSLSSRSTEGGGITPQADVDFSIFDSDGNLLHRPVAAPGSVDTDPISGAETARFDPPDFTIPLDWSGRYYMAYQAHMGGDTGDVWIQDDSIDDPTGLKPIDVVGAPEPPAGAGAVGSESSADPDCTSLLVDDAAGDNGGQPSVRDLTAVYAGEDDNNWYVCFEVADFNDQPGSGTIPGEDQTRFTIFWTAPYEGPGIAYSARAVYNRDGSFASASYLKGAFGFSAGALGGTLNAERTGDTVKLILPKGQIGNPGPGDVATEIGTRAGDNTQGNGNSYDTAPDAGTASYTFGGSDDPVTGNQFYFHGDQVGVAETGDPQAATTFMDRNAPESTEPKVFVKPPGLAGVFPGTVYGPSWTYADGGLGIEEVDITITWYALVAGPTGATGSIVPTNWDLEVWVDDGDGVWTRNDDVPAAQNPDIAASARTTIPVAAGEITELSYSFDDVSAKVDPDGRFAVTVGQVFAVNDGAAAFFYDSVDQPAGLTIEYPDAGDPLVAEAGGPYAGAPEDTIALSGSFTGGDGSATCSWSTADDGVFADPAACDTSVTFATEGSKTVTLAVSDSTGSASDDATVTVAEEPAGERVELLVDGVRHDTVPVSTDDAQPTTSFQGTVDLTGLSGQHTITAEWYDAADALLASDEVTVNVESSTTSSVSFEAPTEDATVEPPVLFSGNYSADVDASDEGGDAGGSASTSSSTSTGGASGALGAAAVMQTLWFQTLSERLDDAPGFLGVTPSLDGAKTLTARYAVEPPADLPTEFVPTGWTLTAEHVTFEPAIRSVQLVPGAGPTSDARTGPPQPAASTGIGPGSAIIMTIPNDGTYGCTANFVWRDANTGKHYLGAAGHCFLPSGATATHGPHADYDASGVRTWVCVEACEFGGLSGQIFTDHTVELGRVAFAQQGPGLVDWLPIDPLGANQVLSFGDDFGLVEIPLEHYDLVRTHLPVWNGPKEPTGSIALGQPIVQYGHSIVFGETFGTQARAGVLSVPWSLETGPWYAAHPGAQGDSGSPVVLAAATDPTTTVVEGTNAIGILTHLGVPAGTTAGTYVDHAVDMATQAGLDVSMLLEGDDLVLPGTTAQFSTKISSFDVAFTDESFSPDGIVEWAWEFGDGASSSDQHPVHTYAGAGTYTASLTVTDGAGVTATASQTLEVTGDPDPTTPTIPNGQTVDVSLSEGESKHFKIPVPADATRLDVVLGGPACDAVSCPLDADLYVRFGERATSNEYDCRPFLTGNDESCAFTSPADGLWYIRVHAFSGSGTVQLTGTHDGSENGAPTASFTYETDNLTVLVDGSASSDPDGDTLTYSWDFGDGATAAGATATHTYEAGGTYTVTLTVADGNGGTDADSQDVTVTSQPASWGVWLRLTGPDGLVFDWTKVKDVEPGTNGTWSQMWDQVNEPAEGEYLAQARLMEDDTVHAHADRTFFVEVPNEAPTADLSADPNPTEEHAEVTFGLSASDADGSIASWSLDFGDASTPAAGTGAPPATVMHAYDQKGVYTANLTVVDDEGAEGYAEVVVTVEDGPNTAPTAQIDGPDRAPAGTEVTFDASGSSDADGTSVEWRWDMGDGTVLFGETVTHSYSDPGKMDIVLTVTDDDGATATATHRHVAQGGGPPG